MKPFRLPMWVGWRQLLRPADRALWMPTRGYGGQVRPLSRSLDLPSWPGLSGMRQLYSPAAGWSGDHGPQCQHHSRRIGARVRWCWCHTPPGPNQRDRAPAPRKSLISLLRFYFQCNFMQVNGFTLQCFCVVFLVKTCKIKTSQYYTQ